MKTTRRFVLLSGAFVLLLLTATSAGAFAIADGYAGHYNTQYTVHSGTLYDNYDPSNHTFGPYASFHFTPEAVSWIKSNTNNNFAGHYKPAISFHSEAIGGGCTNLFADNWAYSNLPSFYTTIQEHCINGAEEVRVVADDVNSLVGNSIDYYTQIQYENHGTTSGDVNISGYWLDRNGNPSGDFGAGGGGRDYETKQCYNASADGSSVGFYHCGP